MRIVNETRKELISGNACAAYSFYRRARGLMLSKPQDMVLISPRQDIISSSIHMMFMLYQIDVIWADEEKRVVEVRKNVAAFNPLKPGTWRTYRPKKPAKYVIELGVGEVGSAEKGDLLSLEADASEALH